MNCFQLIGFFNICKSNAFNLKAILLIQSNAFNLKVFKVVVLQHFQIVFFDTGSEIDQLARRSQFLSEGGIMSRKAHNWFKTLILVRRPCYWLHNDYYRARWPRTFLEV